MMQVTFSSPGNESAIFQFTGDITPATRDQWLRMKLCLVALKSAVSPLLASEYGRNSFRRINGTLFTCSPFIFLSFNHTFAVLNICERQISFSSGGQLATAAL
jgi:hypothetical protein